MRRPLLVLSFALVALLPLRAQEGLVGKVLEKVACVKNPAQTYALYVPSAYKSDKAWPVIFCFDPGARGLEPVKRLQAAAEKYGYIVAGSLNSRNGPWDDNAAAIQGMVADVTAHLRVDTKRVYTAGLSGGARVATQLALSGLSKGVIACSAGFPGTAEDIPGKVPFVFFGTAGTEDFNYAELRRLDRELDDRKATHRIVVFQGGHQWASVELLSEAVEWLDLQAMRSGTKPRDEDRIKAAWQARVAALPSETGERWQATKRLAVEFKGLVEVAELEKKTKEQAATPEVRAWIKADRAAIAREDGLADDIRNAMDGSPATMRKEIQKLRAMADAPEDSADRRMARRVIAGAGASVRESLRSLFTSGDYDVAADLLEMAIAMRPEQTRNYFDLARAQANLGSAKRALEALRRGAEHGLADATRVENEPAFANLKKDPAWPELIAKIRANPPEPNRGFRGR